MAVVGDADLRSLGSQVVSPNVLIGQLRPARKGGQRGRSSGRGRRLGGRGGGLLAGGGDRRRSLGRAGSRERAKLGASLRENVAKRTRLGEGLEDGKLRATRRGAGAVVTKAIGDGIEDTANERAGLRKLAIRKLVGEKVGKLGKRGEVRKVSDRTITHVTSFLRTKGPGTVRDGVMLGALPGSESGVQVKTEMLQKSSESTRKRKRDRRGEPRGKELVMQETVGVGIEG